MSSRASNGSLSAEQRIPCVCFPDEGANRLPSICPPLTEHTTLSRLPRPSSLLPPPQTSPAISARVAGGERDAPDTRCPGEDRWDTLGHLARVRRQEFKRRASREAVPPASCSDSNARSPAASVGGRRRHLAQASVSVVMSGEGCLEPQPQPQPPPSPPAPTLQQEDACHEHDSSTTESLSTACRLKQEGNQCFRSGDYDRALQLYSEALDACPDCCRADRAVLLSNRAAARSHVSPEEREAIVSDCSQALELDGCYLKPRLRRALTYRQMGDEKLDAALEDFKAILASKPHDQEARRAVAELEAAIADRNERLKTEMLGKLKDLGDAVLRPFGLSTSNFQLNQNESGGYSVNFKPPPAAGGANTQA